MNFRLRKFVAFCAVTLSVVAIFGAGVYTGMRVDTRADIEKVVEIQNKTPDVVTSADFAPFWKTWNIINEKYIDGVSGTIAASSTKPVSDQERVWGAISGMVKSLGDPYTVFMPPEEASQFQTDISGSFEGIGMEIGLKDEALIVVAPLEGSPAKRAGIRSGDKILKINGVLSSGLSVEQAVKKIRGPMGTTVALSIVHEGGEKVVEVTIVRETINIPVLELGDRKPNATSTIASASEKKNGLRSDGIFVIRLFNFTAPTPGAFRDALQKFVESGSDKLLLDIRGNPGGYLEAAVDMASWFLPTDKVVVTEIVNKSGAKKVHRSLGYNIFSNKLKFVILVDQGSASAAEILAGALQQNGVANLVGEKTFGKGSVQELIPITDDTFVKVTIAKWLTPDGTSISEHGLTPDFTVAIKEEDIKAGRDPQTDRAVKLLLTGK
ncbi:MAG: S41 family peptidase [Candidatus Vogelbacteria bacterium]|nr:S41 family peptidase [Candidatus Vogelbacteria bacterium]